MFIAFDGIDCTGKSTQIKLLAEYLEKTGKICKVVKEPGGTELGAEIRKLILNRDNNSMLAELALYLADRAENIDKNIFPWRNKNYSSGKHVVITDRYTDSTIAYQAYGKGIVTIDQAIMLNEIFSARMKPHLTFILDMSLDGMYDRLEKRGNLDHFERQDKEFFEKVQRYYQSCKDKDNYVYIDVSGLSTDQVHQKIVFSYKRYNNK